MTQERIPLLPLQESGWDPIGGAGQEAFNVVVDGKGLVRRRPGIASFFTSGDTVVDPLGISGLHPTVGGDLYAIGEGPQLKGVYKLLADSTITLGQKLVGSKRPTFAETQTLLVMCAGGRLKKIVLADNTIDNLGGSPPESTHVIAIASRLATADIRAGLRNNFNYSEPQAGAGIAGYEVWNGDNGSPISGLFTADARPDPIVALHENTNEIFAFGSTNLQNFATDPLTIYAKINTREFGCAAPYSVIKDDQNFAWLDDRRRFVHSDGRQFSILSDPLKQSLDDMEIVSDCFGYRVVHGSVDALVWTFPTDGRTFCYQRGGGWSQWGKWSDGWTQFGVTACSQRKTDSAVIVGMSDGKIGRLKTSAADDLGDEIHAHMLTGFVNRGTINRKNCNNIRVLIRRGEATGSIEPVLLLRWRDDLGPFSSPLEVPLGKVGQKDIVVPFYSLGVYRERQWKCSFLGSETFALAGIIEDFTILDN